MKATREEINKLVSEIRDGKPPRLQHNHSEVTYWHPAFPGFGVRQTYTGQASWIVQYKMHGRTRKQVIGDVRYLDEAEAKAEAKRLWARVMLDRADPQAAKEAARRAAKITFKKTVEEYLQDSVHRLRPKTLIKYRHQLTGYYFKPLHDLPLDEITREDVRQQLESHRPSMALTLGMTLSGLFNWAIEKERLASNPVKPSDLPKAKSRDRVLSDDEIRTIWLAMELRSAWAELPSRSGRQGGTPPVAGYSHMIQLLFLTGCRSDEIGSLTWEEVDLEKKTLAIPGTRTKTHEPLYLPLTDTAVRILKCVKRRPGVKYLFGTKPGKGVPRGIDRKEKVDSYIVKMGATPPTDWVIHDIRRTVRSKMGEIGIRPDIAERVVNHVGHRKEQERVYDRYTYAAEIRDALTRWEAHLLNNIIGEVDKTIITPISESRERRGKRGLVLATLKKGGSIMRATEVAAACGVAANYVRDALDAMATTGEVIKEGRGGGPGRSSRYLHPDNQPTTKPQEQAS